MYTQIPFPQCTGNILDEFDEVSVALSIRPTEKTMMWERQLPRLTSYGTSRPRKVLVVTATDEAELTRAKAWINEKKGLASPVA
ncbi:MAG TPA: hypothetical protein VM597_27015 [Gemmataceae bacterium]|jgi:hypothetical protein|nr:hypothetical protein [Gemmataceae bacterium]